MKVLGLRDKRLEELASGLMDEFRIIRDHPANIAEEMKIYDSMANGAGKIIRAYLADIALRMLEQNRMVSIEDTRE